MLVELKELKELFFFTKSRKILHEGFYLRLL